MKISDRVIHHGGREERAVTEWWRIQVKKLWS